MHTALKLSASAGEIEQCSVSNGAGVQRERYNHLYGSDDIENKKIQTIDIPLDGIIDISGFPTEFDEYKNWW